MEISTILTNYSLFYLISYLDHIIKWNLKLNDLFSMYGSIYLDKSGEEMKDGLQLNPIMK